MPEPEAPDVPLILNVLADTGICADCIVRKTGVAATRVDDVLVRFGHVVRVVTEVSTCSACGKTSVVHRLP